MNVDDVKRTVAATAERLRAAGHRPGGLGWCLQGWGMTVWNEIQRSEPHLAAHMRRHFKPDPYQHMGRWLPYWCRSDDERRF